MLRLILLSTLLFAISCGREGPEGDAGHTPKCDSVEVEGKVFLKCSNPDGSFSMTEVKPGEGRPGEPGLPGEDAVKETFHCEAEWQPNAASENYYEIKYSAVRFKDGSVLASVKSAYHAGTQIAEREPATVLWPKSSPLAQSAVISDFYFTAQLVLGEKAFKFKHRHEGIEVKAPCE